MKTNDGHLEYSLGDGAQTGLRQRPVAHVDASRSTCCSTAVSIGGDGTIAVAVAVKKVINHASRLALGGGAGEGGRGASGGKCILLRLLVRATFWGQGLRIRIRLRMRVGSIRGVADMRGEFARRVVGNIKVGIKASKNINNQKREKAKKIKHQK